MPQLQPPGLQPAVNAPLGSVEFSHALEQRFLSQTKPPGSLGHLEGFARKLALLQGTLFPKVENTRICIFAASHGIAGAGVSAFPSEVTGQMVLNFLSGGAAICVLARAANASLHVIDTGVDAGPPSAPNPRFFQRSLRRGTRSFLHEKAMTPAECDAALEAGREQVRLAIRDRVDALAIGEMGIGNTTAAAALCAGLLRTAPDAFLGRGTGVDDAGLERKRAVLREAVHRHATPLSGAGAARHWLEAVGGYEIAAMTGCILEAAGAQLPVVVDGFIASASALLAGHLQADALECCFFAHESAEAGHAVLLKHLQVTPILRLDLRLGEGTGAALALPLLRAAARLLSEMATFESAGVSNSLPAEARSF